MQAGQLDRARAGSALVGSSEAMQRLRKEIVLAARSDATALISGETGTGKSLVARELHRFSPRAHQPFVVADCAGFAPSLIESELFGHARGAFTGAHIERPGRFEQAGAGTLFLDEIGELPLALQARLLRALQDRDFERVGSNERRRLRARIVAATHRDLAAEVEAGRFRADLFFRLHVVALRVPPLRERASDVAELATSALARIAARAHAHPMPEAPPLCPPRFREPALARLAAHDWPGNVRELANLLERLWLALPPGASWIEPDDVERALRDHRAPRVSEVCAERDRSSNTSLAERAAVHERADLLAALERSRWNVARAARTLGLPRSTLRYRMQIHGIG
jgi:transcriptional regulator with GAF, ATPase, and Fis domain